MFDARLKPLIDPGLNKLGRALASKNISANKVTAIGLVFAGFSFLALAFGAYWVALILILINRLLDGLDGAIARAQHGDQNHPSRQFGGYFDILADFFLYGGFVVSFALGFSNSGFISASFFALFLLFAYLLNAVAFLAYASLKMDKVQGRYQSQKSFYFLSGLAEGTETIIYMVLCCLAPLLFPLFTFIFAVICMLSALGRFIIVYQDYKVLLESHNKEDERTAQKGQDQA